MRCGDDSQSMRCGDGPGMQIDHMTGREEGVLEEAERQGEE
jgi:hypothetical protein